MRLSRSPASGTPPYCAAPLWLVVDVRSYPILPRAVAPYLLVPIVFLIVLVAILEVRLRALAGEGTVVGVEWQIEDQSINDMNRRKIQQTSHDPRWRSAGIPWPERTEGRNRILVVGDSFVWGSGNLNANEIWWRQLARELQRRGYWNVDVVALGLSGASTQDQLAWLKDQQWLQKSDPDLVVFGYVTNDPAIWAPDHREFFVRQIGGDLPLPNWQGLDRTLGLVAPNLTTQLKQLLTKKWASKLSDAYEYGTWELKLLEEPNLSRYQEVLLELEHFLRASQRPHFFVTLPNQPDRTYFEPRYSKVKPAFEAAGVPFHDLLAAFAEENQTTASVLSWGVNPANGHPGPRSTRFFAVKVADMLETHHASVLGLRTAEPSSLRPVINDWMPPEAHVEQSGEGQWTLNLPGSNDSAPQLSLGRKHTFIGFEHPVSMKRVHVALGSEEEVELFAAVLDPVTRLEHRDLIALGARRGPAAEWEVSREHLVHALRLVPISIRDAKREIELKIEFDTPAVRP